VRDRKPGFYWVYRPAFRDWEVAEWTGLVWLETGHKHMFSEDEYSEIDERRIERQQS